MNDVKRFRNVQSFSASDAFTIFAPQFLFSYSI